MLSKLQQFSFFLFLLKKYTKNCRNLYISPKGNISMDGVTQNGNIEQKSSIGSDRKIEVTEEEWEEDERDEWSESDYDEQEEEQNEEQMEWTVAKILNKIENGVKYDWVIIYANNKDDDPWVWIRQTGWLLEPVPYNKKVKDFWLEKDEDGIGVKIILKEDE